MNHQPSTISVTVWNEARHEKKNEAARSVYPEGIHEAIGGHLRGRDGFRVRTAVLDDPDQGLPDQVLRTTDVLVWWGHVAHAEVRDDLVDRVQQRVLEGMGLVVLHSGHFSKVFRRLMGTSGNLRWREANEIERIWVVNPSHPIAAGLGPYIELREEMYGEFFDIPEPDELVLISWFEGGEVFRSGATWHRGKGRIFYFRPGHETYPTFRHPDVLRVIENGVRWAAFAGSAAIENRCSKDEPRSPLRAP
jgi:trehalose utilization protein